MKINRKVCAAGLLVLSGCVDDENFCREPGYTCSQHVKEDKSIICVTPGYTCSQSTDDEDSVSPVSGRRGDTSGAGADSGN